MNNSDRTILNYITISAMDDISSQIRECMKEKHVNQSMLSRAVKIRRQTINHMCNGIPVHFGNLIAVLDYLGFDEITIKWR